MSLYSQFKTDANLENEEGVALDYGDGGVFTIHRAGGSNKKFQRLLTTRLKPYSRRIENGTLSDDVARDILVSTYADAVIVDWHGVKDEKDEELAFTRDNVIKVLTDLPELFADIQEQATKVANFRAEQLEDTAKNSVGGSGSTSASEKKPKR